MFSVRSLCLLVIAEFALALSQSANGQPLAISHSSSPSGTTLLRLTGVTGGCRTFENSTSSVTSNGISIVTPTPPLPGCGISVPRTIFLDITVDVGFLPAARYGVTWSFATPGFPVTLAASAQIDVDGVPSAIPTLSAVALLLVSITVSSIAASMLRNGT